MLNRFKIIGFMILLVISLTGCSNKLNTIKSVEDLNNKNIGVFTGSEYDGIVNSNIKNA